MLTTINLLYTTQLCSIPVNAIRIVKLWCIVTMVYRRTEGCECGKGGRRGSASVKKQFF